MPIVHPWCSFRGFWLPRVYLLKVFNKSPLYFLNFVWPLLQAAPPRHQFPSPRAHVDVSTRGCRLHRRGKRQGSFSSLRSSRSSTGFCFSFVLWENRKVKLHCSDQPAGCCLSPSEMGWHCLTTGSSAPVVSLWFWGVSSGTNCHSSNFQPQNHYPELSINTDPFKNPRNYICLLPINILLLEMLKALQWMPKMSQAKLNAIALFQF